MIIFKFLLLIIFNLYQFCNIFHIILKSLPGSVVFLFYLTEFRLKRRLVIEWDTWKSQALWHDIFGLLQNLENFKLLFLVCQFLLGGLDRCDAVGVLGNRHQAPEGVPKKERVQQRSKDGREYLTDWNQLSP